MIMCLAANIEDAYVGTGVKDYTAKDCFDKGFQMALLMQKLDKKCLGINTTNAFDLDLDDKEKQLAEQYELDQENI